MKERWGGPTFILSRGSWGPTFKFWRGAVLGPHFWTLAGSRVPLLNFEECPGSRVPEFPGSWSPFYTMPLKTNLNNKNININRKHLRKTNQPLTENPSTRKPRKKNPALHPASIVNTKQVIQINPTAKYSHAKKSRKPAEQFRRKAR